MNGFLSIRIISRTYFLGCLLVYSVPVFGADADLLPLIAGDRHSLRVSNASIAAKMLRMSATSPITVSLPDEVWFQPRQTLEIPIRVDRHLQDLSGLDVQVTFDLDMLHYSTVRPPAGIENSLVTSRVDTLTGSRMGGHLRVVATRTPSDTQEDKGDVLLLKFQAQKAVSGNTQITLGEVSLADELGQFFPIAFRNRCSVYIAPYQTSFPDANYQPGETITIPLSTDYAVEIAGIDAKLRYDAAFLTPLAVQTGTLTSGFSLTSSLVEKGVIKVQLSRKDGIVDEKGSLFQLRLRLATATELTVPKSTIDVEYLRVVDASGTPLKVVTQAGRVSVLPTMGDFNGDGLVNSQDAILLLRHIVGYIQFNQFQLASADLNGNRVPDVGDVVLVLRRSVGQSKQTPFVSPTVELHRTEDGAEVQFSETWAAMIVVDRQGESLEIEGDGLLEQRSLSSGSTLVGLASDRLLGTVTMKSHGSGRGLKISSIVLADEYGRIYQVSPTRLPDSYELGANYPNPFNPETSIPFRLPKGGWVTLTIYDLAGHQVRTLIAQQMPGGQHTVTWDGLSESGIGVASGVYFYQLKSGELSQTKSMVLLK